jgi:hypothetical protein
MVSEERRTSRNGSSDSTASAGLSLRMRTHAQRATWFPHGYHYALVRVRTFGGSVPPNARLTVWVEHVSTNFQRTMDSQQCG